LHLPDPHGALDRGRWKQGRIGIDPDRKPAISHLRHIVCKGREILGVEIVSGIGGGKFPCDLRESRRASATTTATENLKHRTTLMSRRPERWPRQGPLLLPQAEWLAGKLRELENNLSGAARHHR
jgi:hypothetical protein